MYAQHYFKKKELQVRQELIRQMEEEKAKNIESAQTDYKKMNPPQNERSSSIESISPNHQPQPVRTPMGYPPVMQQQPRYQPAPHPAYYNPYQPIQGPVVYNPGYMNYPTSPPRQMYVGSPPKSNHKPVQEIKTEVSNIHIKTSNKNYDF